MKRFSRIYLDKQLISRFNIRPKYSISKKSRNFQKMKETEFPVHMHIYTLCSKNLQRITIFRAALFELRLQQQQQPPKQLPKIRNVGLTVILVNAFIKSDDEEI